MEEQAGAFANRLSNLLDGTVSRRAQITSFVVRETGQAFVAPGAKDSAPRVPPRPIVPLSVARLEKTRQGAQLWIRVFYRLRMDDEGAFAAVDKSSFGLCVNPETKSQRMAIRIEYERDKQSYAPAHIQVHGVNPEFAYAHAITGTAICPRLEELHIPVGGRRYRPSLEDFIEFLSDAGLVADHQSGWKAVLDSSRQEYEQRQLKAAIRRDPETAQRGLEQLGYTVLPPG